MTMTENFLSIYKRKCIYCYICFYNYKRFQLKAGEVLLAQRLSYKNFIFLYP